MRRPTRQPDFTRQTAILFRWLVWGAIFVMLMVMIYQAVPDEAAGPSLATLPAPLPEAERPKLPIDVEKLEAIEDNKPFRKVENDALFHLLDVLRSTPEKEIRRASQGPVTWIQLFNQPDVYRGEPITFVGRVKGATRLDTPKNDLGFEKYYQLWLQPHDNRDRLIAIYCLELPKDFPMGLKIDEPVVLTGLFFKRWVYQGQKDFELAPAVLARSLDWTPQPKAVEAEQPIHVMTVMGAIVVAIAISFGIFLFWHLRTRRSKQSDLPEEITIPEKLVDVQSLDEGEVGEDYDDEEEEEE